MLFQYIFLPNISLGWHVIQYLVIWLFPLKGSDQEIFADLELTSSSRTSFGASGGSWTINLMFISSSPNALETEHVNNEESFRLTESILREEMIFRSLISSRFSNLGSSVRSCWLLLSKLHVTFIGLSPIASHFRLIFSPTRTVSLSNFDVKRGGTTE